MPDAYRVRLTPEVLSDLEEIHRHIAKDSPQAAASMVGRLLDAIDSLELFPHRNVVEHQTPKLRYPGAVTTGEALRHLLPRDRGRKGRRHPPHLARGEATAEAVRLTSGGAGAV